MSKFYMTFGQNHFTKGSNICMKDYWIEIEAETPFAAKHLAGKWAEMFIGSSARYSDIYSEGRFEPQFYPKGDFYKTYKESQKNEGVGNIIQSILNNAQWNIAKIMESLQLAKDQKVKEISQ